VPIRPRETAAQQYELVQLGSINESPKATHGSPVKPVVVFILRAMNHVEVTSNEPRQT
jgi:hypothetical protein